MIFDYLILLIFFIIYKIKGIYLAIAFTMLAYAILILYKKLSKKPIEKMQWVTLFLVEILGGMTLIFHNVTFFLFKPTVIYWAFGLSFSFSTFFGKKRPLLEYLLGDKIQLEDKRWRKLNQIWGIFFYILGILNLIIAFNFSVDMWVWYKTFGSLILLVLFVIPQAVYISKHGKAIN